MSEVKRTPGSLESKFAAAPKLGNKPSPVLLPKKPQQPSVGETTSSTAAPSVSGESQIQPDIVPDPKPEKPGNVTVTLPRATFDSVRALARSEGMANTEILAHGIAQVGDEALAARFGGQADGGGDEMPLLIQPRRRMTGGSVPMQLRLTATQLAWLDRKWREAGAPTRSAYVTAVYDMHLEMR